MTPGAFRTKVLAYYRAHGRHDLPWRKTKDPYKILVSEVMLQQTQVTRVVPFYERFLEKFPSVATLAKAPLSQVLSAWQGLGYNRRAKMLHAAAQAVVREHGGKFPKSARALRALPGIGPYTACAVAAFAYNEDSVFIETNIRTAVTHHFFKDAALVKDSELLPILEKALPKGAAREWYWALMDYGAHLKRSGVRINAKSSSYTKQKAFKGSDREARGALLKELTKAPATKARLRGLLGDARTAQLESQLQKLIQEGFVTKKGARYQLAD